MKFKRMLKAWARMWLWIIGWDLSTLSAILIAYETTESPQVTALAIVLPTLAWWSKLHDVIRKFFEANDEWFRDWLERRLNR